MTFHTNQTQIVILVDRQAHPDKHDSHNIFKGGIFQHMYFFGLLVSIFGPVS